MDSCIPFNEVASSNSCHPQLLQLLGGLVYKERATFRACARILEQALQTDASGSMSVEVVIFEIHLGRLGPQVRLQAISK